jgi:hypothetical protein
MKILEFGHMQEKNKFFIICFIFLGFVWQKNSFLLVIKLPKIHISGVCQTHP